MSELSKQALQVENTTSFPNNTTGYITPTLLRTFNSNVIDSTVNQTGYTSNSGSWNISISNLNAFTASQQPTFTALNAFTASQLVINSGVNSFTQSATGRLNNLEAYTSSFSSSVSIYDEGTFVRTVNEINFSGNGITASYVSGQAVIAVDFTSLNNFTASQLTINSGYNSFSASTNVSITNLNAYTASQNSFNTSATASISQLLSFSSSLDATYATDAQLNASASALQANIDTKLNTSSFNDYTASQGGLNPFTSSLNTYTASNDTKWNTIGLLTGSYATTGSNVFTGSQTITGSVYGNIIPLTISSNTASMDLSKGNFFTLTLVSGSTTQLAASNIKAGQTINLLVTQAAVSSGSLSYNTTFKFTPGNQYTASISSSAKDILTFITFDNSNIYASAIKNLV